MRRVTLLLAFFLCAMVFCALSACNDTTDTRTATFEVDYSKVRSEVDFDTKLDLSGLTVRLKYSDNTYRLLPMGGEDGYTVDTGGYDRAVPDTYTITISYKDYAPVRFDITVLETRGGEEGEEVFLQSITIKTNTGKKIFALGADFTYEGLSVIKHFSDGSTEEINEGFTVDSSKFNKDVTGPYVITVEYTEDESEFSTEYTVIVVDEL